MHGSMVAPSHNDRPHSGESRSLESLPRFLQQVPGERLLQGPRMKQIRRVHKLLCKNKQPLFNVLQIMKFLDGHSFQRILHYAVQCKEVSNDRLCKQLLNKLVREYPACHEIIRALPTIARYIPDGAKDSLRSQANSKSAKTMLLLLNHTMGYYMSDKL